METLKDSKSMSITTTESEYNLIKDFAKFQGKSISSLVLDLVREKMEELEDIQDAKEILASQEPTISWQELKQKNGF